MPFLAGVSLLLLVGLGLTMPFPCENRLVYAFRGIYRLVGWTGS